MESGDGGHLVGVGRRGAHRQGAADAVAEHGGRSGADLGLSGEEPEVGVGVALDAFGGVGLDQGHQPADDRGPDLFSDVLGKVDHRRRAVPVGEVGDEHVVPVSTRRRRGPRGGSATAPFEEWARTGPYGAQESTGSPNRAWRNGVPVVIATGPGPPDRSRRRHHP